MEKGRVRSLDSTICIKQYLIQQQLAQRAQGHTNLLISPPILSGNEDFLFCLLPIGHRSCEQL